MTADSAVIVDLQTVWKDKHKIYDTFLKRCLKMCLFQPGNKKAAKQQSIQTNLFKGIKLLFDLLSLRINMRSFLPFAKHNEAVKSNTLH